MKRQFTFMRKTVLLAGLVILAVSCGSKKVTPKKTAEQMGETFIIVPCSVSEDKAAYGPDKEFFRANAVGESLDQMTSKRKALTSARAQLAANIQTVIKSVVDDYIKDVDVDKKESFERKYEGLTREVIEQQLNDVRTTCEKQAITANSNYKTYVAIEMSKDAVAQALAKRVSQDEQLKVDYDYQKFKETFDKEMEKMQEGRR